MPVTIDGEKWFTCEFCQTHFVKQQSDLEIVETVFISGMDCHEETDKQYACPDCAKEFAS